MAGVVLRKRKRETKSKDVISDLPSNVISCILDRIPLRDAVRTSVLSTKWRSNWTMVTHLDFGFQFYKKNLTVAEEKHRKFVKYEFKYEFERIINKVLILHMGNLAKVTIYIPGLNSDLVPDIQPWLHILSKKNIKELTLDQPHTEPYKLLPSCLFSCLNLTYLKLQNFICTPPPAFKGFRDLVSLLFARVKFTTNIFEILVSGSPLLQKLVFLQCSGIDHFVIHAPNLTILRVLANGEFKSVSFKNVPKLTEVSLGLSEIVDIHGHYEDSPFVRYLNDMHKVKKLCFNGNFLNFMAAVTVPMRLPTMAGHLKKLELQQLDFCNFDEIQCVLSLLRSSPNLKELEIWGFKRVNADPELVSEVLEAQDCTQFTLGKLKAVKIQCLMGSKPELEFIEFLLTNSPSLEKMCIDPHPKLDDQKALKVATELIRFYRASPKVEVRYLDAH